MNADYRPAKQVGDTGFTLVELLIALFIFGLLAAAGTSLLVYSTSAQAVTASRLGDLSNEQRLTNLLTNDLAQALPRISRDVQGSPMPAFASGSLPLLFRYIRGGVQNGDDSEQSGLQNIEIRLSGDRIERVVSSAVDGSSDVRSQMLVSDVAGATVRFRRDGAWQTFWTPEDPAALPQAVELNITKRGKPQVTRLFLVGSGR
jgi:general secretion pathway protein J